MRRRFTVHRKKQTVKVIKFRHKKRSKTSAKKHVKVPHKKRTVQSSQTVLSFRHPARPAPQIHLPPRVRQVGRHRLTILRAEPPFTQAPVSLAKRKPRDKRPSVLILLDEYGWAHDFVSRGIIKYCKKFKCRAKKWSAVTRHDRRYDIIFAMNLSVWHALGDKRRWFRRKKLCIGVRTGRLEAGFKNELRKFHVIGCNSVTVYRRLCKAYPSLRGRIFYTPNGVDTGIFKPHALTGRFKVGWAGAAGRKSKCVGLAKKLKFPVKMMCKRGKKYFRKGISRKSMIQFYKSIDCLVCTSSSEGMNNVVLEAAASGLPVVSTAVGDISRLINRQWLVPRTRKKLVSQMNEKLHLLKENVHLRRAVGKRNRLVAVKYWSWKKQVKHYEKMFEAALTK